MLSERLKAAANLFCEGNCVADIGCDHGYLPIELVKRGTFKSAIAADVNDEPLRRAQDNILLEGLSQISCRKSDGLREFEPGEVDAVSICGMGGNLMMRIISEGMDVCQSVSQLVLSPQSELPAFRQFVCENGFRIDTEDMVLEDGKYYFLMRIVPDSRDAATIVSEYCNLTGFDLLPSEMRYLAFKFGGFLINERNLILNKFLSSQFEKNNQIIESLNKYSKDGEMRRNELEYECRLIHKLLKGD